ncbi:NACHT domain-containing protein [Hirsutella rhossiliensis]|uniref:NACHT domain-containing protein n=1 Tax=Hirsutella rhossiliensis TaxID=111463 RepID=A0A9P8MR65_9HYPO|nr:NACHT domain-containing protein [Hirsutella rhossiliensis]KAH0958979.1 NACHT domain-containing protein [Hirsutella rhossiliensis]
MDWVRSGLVLLAGVAGAIYLWLAKNKENTRPQPAVGQGHSTSESSPERKKDRPRPPLEILYPGPTDFSNDDTEIDIVAVHGLGSNVDWSWTWKDDEKCINWLRDPGMLPAKVPKSRIIAYNYESRWHADAPKTRLQLCGEELVHSLHLFRDGAPDRPIVFVGHSLGGNVIVHALLHARDEENYKHLPMATVGLVFLGTPFRGTKWQPFVDSLAQLMGSAGSHRGITRELGFDGPELLDRLHRFCRLRNSLSTPVSCFSELYETDYGRRLGVSGVAKGMIVEEASACIPGLDRYALQTDHLKINKYQGPTDRSFERVSAVISEMCRGAKDVVRRRHDPREIVTDNRSALKHKPEAETCLVDLFVTDPLEDKMNLKRKKGDRARGTCEWILGTEALTAWLGPSQTELTESQATNVLWLRGYPGTGKSTMAIFLTEALSAAFSATYGKTLAYFFCDSGFGTRKTATSVVRGLLLQLVQQHPQLLDYVLPKYNERRAKLFESFDALWTIFMAAAADQHTGQKYCIIDALDECDQESQKILLRQLQETFQSQHAPSNLRILITSRPYPEIREYLEIFANEDLASFPEAKQDIDRCIQERVANLAERKRYTDKVKGRVGDILRDKADGTFLWVGLACNELEDVPSKDAIPVLEGMPKGLHSLYKRLLHTALERDTAKADDVRLILSFVAVCLRPLSVLELSEACQLHMNEDDAETRAQFTREHVESCRLMVIIQDEKVLLLHQSVKDFLAEAGADHFINELKAHARLAHRCVDLLIKEFRNLGNGKEVMTLLLDRRGDQITITDEVVKAAAGNFRNGKEVMALLLDRRGDQITITDGVVKAAAGNEDEGKEVMALLLDRRGDQITITDEVVKAAAGNSWNGKEVMALLLDQRGDQITITDEVVKAAAGNSGNGKEVMALLLDRRGDQITITDEVVKAAAGNFGNGKEVMALLLDRRGDQITITDEVVKAAAGNFRNGKEVMALLLNRRGDQITITDEVVKAAAGNSGNGKEVMTLLLDRRGDQITITDEVVKAAAGNEDEGKKVMALILDRRGDQITITDEVVKAAAGNSRNGREVIALLLDRQRDQITITDEVVKAAAGNSGNGKEVMALLLDRRGDQITITDEVVKAAAGNEDEGKKVMALILDQRGDQITITDEVVKAAAGNSGNGKEVMALLLDRRGDQITITDERGDQITITDEVVKAAAGNSGNGKEVMALLLDRRGDQITITDEVVKAAAGNFGNGKEVMALLLDRRGDQITITDEVVKAAAGNFRNGKEVMALLLNRRGDQITITDEVVKAAAGNEDEGKEVMALILDQRGDQITITDEVAEAAATCGQHGVLNLLSQNGLVSVREEWRCIANFYNAATAGQLPGDHLCSGHLGVVWNEL